MTASALPVGFLLIYQYCTKNKKNFYFYSLVLSAVFSFGFATIEDYFGLVEMRKGLNQIHIFFIDVAIAYISYWFTKLILKMRDRGIQG
jgi:UDP-N-acetylmuramyl pentapeptide phosphotransferase/UDP-N-acetylglucosamine-1-phosphate transferase